MELLLNAGQMKACDAYTIHRIGIPSVVLMERAALAVVDEMIRLGLDLTRVLVLCGSGNNGGDGFAVARLLSKTDRSGQEVISRESCRVTLGFVGNESSMTDETALERRICENCGMKISSNFMDGEYTTIVDAIFGIGLSRPVEGRYAEVIRWVNRQSASVVSVDIPSGISADNGHMLGEAVRADLTVTFASRKIGQVLYPGAAYCGKLVCKEVGIMTAGSEPLPSGEKQTGKTDKADKTGKTDKTDMRRVFTYTDQDLIKVPVRSPHSNKGTFGKVLLIAGSEGMSGAACLAARAAYRTGCGMVRVFTPECNRMVLQTCLPEAIVTAWNPHSPMREIENLLTAAFDWSDVAGIGPGLGMATPSADILGFVLREYRKPLVIDADGLNLLSENRGLMKLLHSDIVLTPHIGEMARLTGKEKNMISEDILNSSCDFADAHGTICALKDSRTVVSDGNQIYVNTSGNDGMAVAGSGDVLTGIICGLLAQGMPCFEAAAIGVYVHGRAGDRAKDDLGAYGMIAGDIAERVGQILACHSAGTEPKGRKDK
ncbi:MAG: NAD(P)H-hydrate dehydratase [Lachnospiraceae bacterium]|nr:NAD(P)H-hydrate dehydratase [Lachnospiraceae bacterium]